MWLGRQTGGWRSRGAAERAGISGAQATAAGGPRERARVGKGEKSSRERR